MGQHHHVHGIINSDVVNGTPHDACTNLWVFLTSDGHETCTAKALKASHQRKHCFLFIHKRSLVVFFYRYTLRCKSIDERGKVVLDFEMEVCLIPKMEIIGVYWKLLCV